MCRLTVADRSRALLILLSRSWMRKVVGSNPGAGDWYSSSSLSFVEVDRSIEKRKLIWLDEANWNTQQCDRNEAKQEVVWINLLQMDVAPSSNIVVNINVMMKWNIDLRWSKRGSPLRTAHIKKDWSGYWDYFRYLWKQLNKNNLP